MNLDNIYIVTYLGDPGNFDLVKLLTGGNIISTALLATSEKEDAWHTHHKTRFYSEAVWNRQARKATQEDMDRCEQASYKAKEFTKLLNPSPTPIRRLNMPKPSRGDK